MKSRCEEQGRKEEEKGMIERLNIFAQMEERTNALKAECTLE